MVAPITNTNVFDELAAAVVGLVTKKAFSQFFEKSEDEKVKIISKTIASALAAGILGSVLTPSGTFVFVVAGVLSFSHFARTVNIADFAEKAVKNVREQLSLFNELADSVTDIVSGRSFHSFLALPSYEAQAVTAAKAAAVALSVGLIGSVIGFVGTSLTLVTLPFTFAHFTRPEKVAGAPILEPVPVAEQFSEKA